MVLNFYRHVYSYFGGDVYFGFFSYFFIIKQVWSASYFMVLIAYIVGFISSHTNRCSGGGALVMIKEPKMEIKVNFM
jgi:hypothetical protein